MSRTAVLCGTWKYLKDSAAPLANNATHTNKHKHKHDTMPPRRDTSFRFSDVVLLVTRLAMPQPKYRP